MKKQCFIICPIGEDNSEIRKRSDQIFKHIILPATNECEYIPTRADQIAEPGIITNQVIQRIFESDLVIADLTFCNPNVFYELALRHAIKKPLVQISQEGEKIPFDVAGMRTITFNHQDLDSVADAKQEIIDQIKSFKDSSSMETPISLAINIKDYLKSADREKNLVANLFEEVIYLRSAIHTQSANLSQITNDLKILLRSQTTPDFLRPEITRFGGGGPGSGTPTTIAFGPGTPLIPKQDVPLTGHVFTDQPSKEKRPISKDNKKRQS